jgi:hypothetical protein
VAPSARFGPQSRNESFIAVNARDYPFRINRFAKASACGRAAQPRTIRRELGVQPAGDPQKIGAGEGDAAGGGKARRAPDMQEDGRALAGRGAGQFQSVVRIRS